MAASFKVLKAFTWSRKAR